MQYKHFISAAIVLFGALVLAGCETPPLPPAAPTSKVEGESVQFSAGAPELATIQSLEIRMQPVPPSTLNGRVVWNEDRTVRIVAALGGRVERILVQPGQPVARGSALAVIASPELGQAQADAGRAESDYALAEKNLQRVRELEQHGVAPRKDLQAAEAEHQRAQAEATRARRRLALYGGSGRGIDQQYTLTSPIAGIVVERNINPGQEVRADAPSPSSPALFVITDPASLWVQIDAREKDLPLLKPGKRVGVHTPVYPGRIFPATVEAVADSLDAATHTIKVRARADNPERFLKNEMFVRATFDFDGAQELLVPTKALYFQAERHYVMVDEGGGRYTRRAVQAGDVRGDLTEILDGLRDAEKVVVEGTLMLQQVLKPRRVQK